MKKAVKVKSASDISGNNLTAWEKWLLRKAEEEQKNQIMRKQKLNDKRVKVKEEKQVFIFLIFNIFVSVCVYLYVSKINQNCSVVKIKISIYVRRPDERGLMSAIQKI